MSELLPCPFCGGKPEADRSYQVGVYFGCDSCGVWKLGADGWNTRAPTAIPAGYKLVPIEPTPAMEGTASFNLCSEFGISFTKGNRDFALAAYRELVDAAPQPTTEHCEVSGFEVGKK